MVKRRGFFVFPSKKVSLGRIGQGEGWIIGDHQFIASPKALLFPLLVCRRVHEFLHFLHLKQAIHVVVVAQKVTGEFLGLSQTAVLGRDGLELLDKSVCRRVAEHIGDTVVENFNGPGSSRNLKPKRRW